MSITLERLGVNIDSLRARYATLARTERQLAQVGDGATYSTDRELHAKSKLDFLGLYFGAKITTSRTSCPDGF